MSEKVTDPRAGLPSASGIARIALCPGSLRAERGLPESSGDDAVEGTFLHSLLEDPKASRKECDPEQLEAVEWCEEQCEKAALQNGFDPTDFTAEDRLWAHDGKLDPMYSGQFDRLYISGKRALAPDFKFGRLPVAEATNNLQMRTTAVLLFDNLDIDELIVGILQPRLNKTSFAVYDRKSYEMAKSEILGYIENGAHPDAPRIPNVDACRYCKAKVLCPEYNKVLHVFTDMPLITLSPEHLAMALERIELLKPLQKAIEAAAKAMLSEGTEIPGWELGKPREIRKISDPELALQRMLELDDISQEDVLAIVKLGIGDTEKLVHKATGLKGKALKERTGELLKDLIKSTESAPPLKKIKAKK